MANVHFEPGARSAWHKHAVGQYTHVVEGTAYVQERGGKLFILNPGDTIYTEPDVEHWQGASPDSFMYRGYGKTRRRKRRRNNLA